MALTDSMLRESMLAAYVKLVNLDLDKLLATAKRNEAQAYLGSTDETIDEARRNEYTKAHMRARKDVKRVEESIRMRDEYKRHFIGE
jgi:hypothetical protein